MPGRIIGVSRCPRQDRLPHDAADARTAHPPRKANSNICTSQVLLANMAGMYAVYHGPQGLKTIAARIHRLTAILADGLKRAGRRRATKQFFDT